MSGIEVLLDGVLHNSLQHLGTMHLHIGIVLLLHGLPQQLSLLFPLFILRMLFNCFLFASFLTAADATCTSRTFLMFFIKSRSSRKGLRRRSRAIPSTHRVMRLRGQLLLLRLLRLHVKLQIEVVDLLRLIFHFLFVLDVREALL